MHLRVVVCIWSTLSLEMNRCEPGAKFTLHPIAINYMGIGLRSDTPPDGSGERRNTSLEKVAF